MLSGDNHHQNGTNFVCFEVCGGNVLTGTNDEGTLAGILTGTGVNTVRKGG